MDMNNQEEVIFKRNVYTEWDVNSTKLLIHIYKENRHKVGTMAIRTMKKLWEKISNEFVNYNYSYSASNCENKWKVLERNFKKYVDHQNKTGRGRKVFEFFDDMKTIYEQKRNIFPQILLTNNQAIYHHMPNHDSILLQGPSTSCHSIATPETSSENVEPGGRSTIENTPSTKREVRKKKRSKQLQNHELSEEYYRERIKYFKDKREYYKKKTEKDDEFVNEIKEIKVMLKEYFQSKSD